MSRFPLNFCLLSALVAFAGCSTAPSLTTVTVDQDAMLSRPDATQSVKVARGEVVTLDERTPTLVEAPGYLPMLLLPLRAAPKQLSLRLLRLPKGQGDPSEWWPSIDRLLSDIERVEGMLRENRAREGVVLTEELLSRFPKLKRLRLLKASCLIVLGERSAADALMKSLEAEDKAEAKAENVVGEEPKTKRNSEEGK